MDRKYDVITFISKYLFLRRTRVTIFTNIIKIVTMFIKTVKKSLKTQKKLRELEIMHQNAIYICISWKKNNSF